jgi:peptidoglycan/LPS O-acetylase OafA/YrhL
MYSPLSWVMNAGFFLFGIVILAGVAALRGLSGRRRLAALVPAIVLALGGVLLALFPGSGEALETIRGDFHAMGAFAGFLGGNILAILLGAMRRRIGFSSRIGRTLVAVGVIGLISTAAYFIMLVSSDGGGAIGLAGLIERGATHPFLIGLLCAGAAKATS